MEVTDGQAQASGIFLELGQSLCNHRELEQVRVHSPNSNQEMLPVEKMDINQVACYKSFAGDIGIGPQQVGSKGLIQGRKKNLAS